MSQQVEERRLPRALTPFRHPAYRRLAVALTLSTFASGVWVVGLVWEVIRIGGGPAQLSMVSTAGAIGVLLPALLGGVVADRVPQKLILLVVAAVELTGMALVATLSVTDRTELWHVATVSFTTGMGMAFYYPAYSAWLPALVPESDLMAVNTVPLTPVRRDLEAEAERRHPVASALLRVGQPDAGVHGAGGSGLRGD